MARPYSIDLRERVVSAAESGETCRSVGKRFGVAVSCVVKWRQRYLRTVSVAPGQMGGHRPRLIAGAHEAWLRERMMAGDFTLRGLVAELAARGLKVDYRTVWSFAHRAGLSFQKNRSGKRARTARCGPAPGALEDTSGQDRPDPPGLHR